MSRWPFVPREGESISGVVGRDHVKADYLIDPETGCWVWQKNKLKGYAMTGGGNRGKSGRAARIYFKLAFGDEALPAGYDCHHKCENVGCVNPDHLEAIPWLEHRHAHFLARTGLTPEKVVELRTLGCDPAYSNVQLCEMFGICDKTLWSILNGKRWAHFGGPEKVCWYTHCQWCEAELTSRRRDQKFCDAKCRGKFQRAHKASTDVAA